MSFARFTQLIAEGRSDNLRLVNPEITRVDLPVFPQRETPLPAEFERQVAEAQALLKAGESVGAIVSRTKLSVATIRRLARQK